MEDELRQTTLNVFKASAKNVNANDLALVFLHYFGGSSQSWAEVIGGLAADFYCLAPDLPGFGATPEARNYSVKDYADAVSDLIEKSKLARFALIGHSMGGKIALAVAARQPANLQTLILLAPSPPTPEPMSEAERSRLLQSHGDRSAAEETIKKAVANPLPPAIFERAAADNLRTAKTAWQWWLERGSREDISAQLENIEVPILIAAGEQDETMTAELLTVEIVRRSKHASLTIVPNTKHLLPLEAPTAVANLIKGRC